MLTPIEFLSVMVARREDGQLLISLFDGPDQQDCVAMLLCDRVTAWALMVSVAGVISIER